MKVIFAGGGTAGHVNPAVSIAQFIKSRHNDAQIIFIGNDNSIEQRIVNKNGYGFEVIDVEGLRRSLSPKNIAVVTKALKSVRQAKRILIAQKPDLVIGTGGYVSFPVLLAASQLGIPTAIHEQNAFPGMTSKILSKKVDRVMISFKDSTVRFPKQAKMTLVGNPIRESFVFADKAKARQKLGIGEDEKYVVSFAGSLGAREINKAIVDFIVCNSKNKKIRHTHATGKYGYRWMPDMLKERSITKESFPQLDLREYIDNMATVMAAADIVIGRGGAGTISELLALGKPSILIPSPNVTNNHQYYNVKSLVDSNAAIMVEESQLDGKKLYDLVLELLSDNKRLNELSENAFKLAIYDSSQKIYDTVMKLL